MSLLEEKADWERGIYELRTSDPVLGGSEGISNRQAAQLANRTQWLKKAVESHADAPDPHPQYREISEAMEKALQLLEGSLDTMSGNMRRMADDVDALQSSNTQMWGALGTPPGTRSLFAQSTAPTGWTKVMEHNDKALRVVNGAASSGGFASFSVVFDNRDMTGVSGETTLSSGQMPGHYHIDGGGGIGNSKLIKYGSTAMSGFVFDTGLATNNKTLHPHTSTTGSSQPHSHGLSLDPLDLRVQYVDVIIASKDYYEPT